MSPLRWLGVISALAFAVYVFHLFRRRRIRRWDFLLGALCALGLFVVSIAPHSVSYLRDMLFLAPDQFSRLIALCIISNILLWAAVLYTRSKWYVHAAQFDALVRRLGVDAFQKNYPALSKLPPVTVVIPAYNEEENIGVVLENMPREASGRRVTALVIDDGSRDRTFDVVAEAGFPVVRNPVNRGGGAALRVGFDIAAAYGAEVIVTLDADGQHLPEEMGRLIDPIVQGQYDLVIGSRLLGRYEKGSFVRQMGIHVFNFCIRVLTPVRITDCSSGYRAFRVDILPRVLLRQDQYHTAEMIIDAARCGLRIGEAPITIKRRLTGESKKGKNWRYGFNFAQAIFKSWWR